MYDGVDEVLASEEFATILSRIQELAAHHERQLIKAAADAPVETIRLQAGRLAGIRMVYDLLHSARKGAKSA